MIKFRFLKYFFVFILIVGLLLPSFTSREAKAEVVTTIVQCIGTATLSTVINIGISIGINYISRILGGPTIVLQIPELNKEFILDVVERCFARAIMDNTIGALLNTIRTRGRDGGASYVRNWRNFLTNSEYRGENMFRVIAANTQFCNHLQKDISDIFGITTKFKLPLTGQNTRTGDADPFTLKARCSLPSNFSLTNFQKDFGKNGGWTRVLELAKPENNIFGALLNSREEQAKQKEIEKQADLNDVSNPGFQSIVGGCLVKAPSGRCIVYANINTPGGYLRAIADATIDAEFDWITAVDEFKEIVVTGLTQRLTNRLLNFGSSEADPTYNNEQTGASVNPGPLDIGLTAVCSGGSTPVVTLTWFQHKIQTSNSLQKKINNGGYAFLFQETRAPFRTFQYVDRAVSIGQTYTYRVKYSPLFSSNEVTLKLGAQTCNEVAPPTPFPVTPAPAPGPGPGPNPSTVPPTGQCPQTSPQFSGQVNGAIDSYIAANPSFFNGDEILTDVNNYVQGVVSRISGLTAQQDPNAGDEIQVKQSNTFSEQWDIVREPAGGGQFVSRRYAATCTPAAF